MRLNEDEDRMKEQLTHDVWRRERERDVRGQYHERSGPLFLLLHLSPSM